MIQLTYRVQAVFLSYIQVGPLLASDQRLTVSEMAVLLTESVFQGSAVSKMRDLLTEPKFQGHVVSKKGDLLTGRRMLRRDEKAHDIDIRYWLEDTLKRIPTEKDITMLLPENWQPVTAK